MTAILAVAAQELAQMGADVGLSGQVADQLALARKAQAGGTVVDIDVGWRSSGGQVFARNKTFTVQHIRWTESPRSVSL
jgi:hypothetical protein